MNEEQVVHLDGFTQAHGNLEMVYKRFVRSASVASKVECFTRNLFFRIELKFPLMLKSDCAKPY